MSEKVKASLVTVITIIVLVGVGYGIYLSGNNGSTSQSTVSDAAATSDNSATAKSAANTSASGNSITFSTLSTHNTVGSDCWVAIEGKVYDVTSYSHPKYDPFTCGEDNTSGWDSIRKHTSSMLDLVKYIGVYSG